MSSKNKGPIYDPGLCRCCGILKKCRLLNVEYQFMGQKEIYCDMLVDCFGLLLCHLDEAPDDRLICATCVGRLREASSFRKQVIQCEEAFVKVKLHHSVKEVNTTSKEFGLDTKKEEANVKLEPFEDDNAAPSPLADDHLQDAGCSEEIMNSSKYCISVVPVKSEPMNEDSVSNDDIPISECVTKWKKDEGVENNDKEPSTVVKPQKKKVEKEVKTPVKTKRLQKTKTSTNKSEDEKKQLLQHMQLLKEQLKEIDKSDLAEYTPKKPCLKVIDNEQKTFHNTIAIIENSFACPFDTSYSDYFCAYCKQLFTQSNKLRDHTLTHDPKTIREFIANKKIIQVDVQRIDCRLCSEKIDTIDRLKTHLNSAHGMNLYLDVTNEFLIFKLEESNFCCLECGKKFSYFHALKKHMAEHFGSCICHLCGAHYFEERMLLLHLRSHKQNNIELYSCKYCEKSFKSRHNRYLHEAGVHKKEPAYPCNRCDAMFFSYAQRETHKMEVHREERKFTCEHCSQVYSRRKSLREHVRRSHLKRFKHNCGLCDRSFYIPSQLKEHMVTHTGERNFRCEFCGKSYPRLRALRVHVNSHSSDKRYKCGLCSASFTQNVNLRNHLKRQHQEADELALIE